MLYINLSIFIRIIEISKLFRIKKIQNYASDHTTRHIAILFRYTNHVKNRKISKYKIKRRFERKIIK